MSFPNEVCQNVVRHVALREGGHATIDWLGFAKHVRLLLFSILTRQG